MEADLVNPRRDAPPPASVDDPNRGNVVLRVDGELLLVSEALHWIEDDEHIIASSEFQVSASGPDFGSAFSAMLDNVSAEAIALAELVQRDEAAPNELHEAALLAKRFGRIVEAEEQAQRRKEKVRIAFRRRSLERGRHWQIQHRRREHSTGPSPV